MMPPWTIAEWSLIIGAVGGFIASAAGTAKIWAEVTEIRSRVDAAAHVRGQALIAAQQARDELRPNGGSTVKDAVVAIRSDMRVVRTEVEFLRGDLRSVREDIGRLAEVDLADRAAAAEAHEHLHQRIDQLRHEG